MVEVQQAPKVVTQEPKVHKVEEVPLVRQELKGRYQVLQEIKEHKAQHKEQQVLREVLQELKVHKVGEVQQEVKEPKVLREV